MLIICKFGYSFGLILHSLLILPTVGPLEMQKRHNCQTHLRLTKFSFFQLLWKEQGILLALFLTWVSSRTASGVNIQVENNVSYNLTTHLIAFALIHILKFVFFPPTICYLVATPTLGLCYVKIKSDQSLRQNYLVISWKLCCLFLFLFSSHKSRITSKSGNATK